MARTYYKVVDASGKDRGMPCYTLEEVLSELRHFTRHDVGEGPYTYREVVVPAREGARDSEEATP